MLESSSEDLLAGKQMGKIENEYIKNPTSINNFQEKSIIPIEKLRIRYHEIYEKFSNHISDQKFIDNILLENYTKYSIYGKLREYIILSNIIFSEFIISKHDMRINPDIFIKNYVQSAKFYENETLEHRKILSMYHVFQCKNKIDSCNLQNCIDFHESKLSRVRKRPLYFDKIWNYIPKMCPNKNECNDMECIFSHTDSEINFHPLKYKTIPCKIIDCKDLQCFYAHFDNSDLRNLLNLFGNFKYSNKIVDHLENHFINLDSECKIFNFPLQKINSYKTQPCDNPKCTQDFLCEEYFHNFNEKRRPKTSEYLPIMCPNIYKNNEICDASLCPNRDLCKFCHNFFEYDFHPLVYKTRPCLNIKNCKGIYCPYKHGNEILLTNENYNEIIEKLMKTCDKLKEHKKALETITKDWKCDKCKFIINNLKNIGKIAGENQYFICNDCE